jgi:hypothetical protein
MLLDFFTAWHGTHFEISNLTDHGCRKPEVHNITKSTENILINL